MTFIADKNDVVKGMDELNKYYGKKIYAFMLHDKFVFSTRKDVINEYLKKEDVCDVYNNTVYLDDAIYMIYGVVLNQSVLPFELPKELNDCCVWVIYHEETYEYYEYNAVEAPLFNTVMEEFCSIAEATEFIEDLFIQNDIESIDSIAVIAGYRLKLILQTPPHTHYINVKGLGVGDVKD